MHKTLSKYFIFDSYGTQIHTKYSGCGGKNEMDFQGGYDF